MNDLCEKLKEILKDETKEVVSNNKNNIVSDNNIEDVDKNKSNTFSNSFINNEENYEQISPIFKDGELVKDDLDEEETTILKEEQANFFYDLILEELSLYEGYYEESKLSLDYPIDIKKRECEDRIIDLIDENEDALTTKDEYKYQRIINRVFDYRFENVISRMLDSHEASLIQDEFGNNLGMRAAQHGMEELAMKALDNHEASIQQDCYDCNIGMHCAQNKLEKATIKALGNEEASLQQNLAGWTIGMYAESYALKEATNVALKNKKAIKLRDENNESILDIILDNPDFKSDNIFEDNSIDLDDAFTA